MVATMAPWVPVLVTLENELSQIEQAVIQNIAQEMAVAQQQWARLLGNDTSSTNPSTEAAVPSPASHLGSSNGSSSTNVAPIASKNGGAVTDSGSDNIAWTTRHYAANTLAQPLTSNSASNSSISPETPDFGGNGTVSGQVWLDNNGDGSEDDGEMGYSGATVYLDLPTGQQIMSTTTDTSGNYQFKLNNLLYGLPQQFEIQVVLPSGDEATYEGADSDIDAEGYSPVFTLNPNEVLNVPAAMRSTVVTTTQDDANGPIQNQITLRDAINTVINGLNNPVTFTQDGTISLQAKLPNLSTNITIDGPGANVLTVQGNASAQTPYSVFLVPKGVAAEIDGLTIQGGYAPIGGGISNDGNLILQNDVIRDNTATSSGGGIQNGVNNGAILSLENDTIAYNTAEAGGGIYNDDTLQSYLEQDTSSIFLNTATQNGGGIYNLGTVNFAGAGESIYDNEANTATGEGGGVYNGTKATFTLSYGSINGNGAFQGGALYNLGTATLEAGTEVESNDANQGGGIYLLLNSSTTFNRVTVSGNKLVGNNPIAKGVGYINPCVMNITSLTDSDDPMGQPVKIGG